MLDVSEREECIVASRFVSLLIVGEREECIVASSFVSLLIVGEREECIAASSFVSLLIVGEREDCIAASSFVSCWREEGVVALHLTIESLKKNAFVWSLYGDVNPAPSSPLASK